MFSILRKMLERVRSFDAVLDRIEILESKLDRFTRIADENESLWQFLDEQKEKDGLWTGSAEDFEDEISDMMVRNMKPQGDA
jgi:3-methyladenine DNA glycosylase Tag